MDAYSICQDCVHTGLWTDQSDGRVLLTLPVRSAGYLIAATASFITIVGSCIWSLERLFMHDYFARKKRSDGWSLYHRVHLHNADSAPSTIWMMGKIYSAYAGLTPKAKRLRRRTLALISFPLITQIAVTVASVFSSRIAGTGYETTNVLLKPHNCGQLALNLGLNDTMSWQLQRFMAQTAINNTQAARRYAHDCYQLTSSSGLCSMFPTRFLSYSANVVECPFGGTPAGNNICQPNGGKALELVTDSLDTDKMFGVNVPVENQLEVKKSLTCAPIDVSEYIRTDNPGLDDATTYLELGPIVGQTTYTMLHKPRSKDDNIGYQLFSLTSGGGGVWMPTDALKVSHGDVSITMLAGNSMNYLEPVKDPWFSANLYNNYTNAYNNDNELSVVACIDQYQICNPSATNVSTCTILSGLDEVMEASTMIGLNKYQKVLAARILLLLGTSSLWLSIDFQGAGSLLASQNVIGLTSTGLPDDQWQREVLDWFTTSLAAMQAGVVRYVNNLDQADLGVYASIARPSESLTGVPEDYFCSRQRVRNTGSYISFSFAWLMVIYCVGLALIGLSFATESVLDKLHKGFAKRKVVRTADSLLQIMRKMLENPENENDSDGLKNKWSRQMKNVPVPSADVVFLSPEHSRNSDDGQKPKDFLPSRVEIAEADMNHRDSFGLVSREGPITRTDIDETREGKKTFLPEITVSEELEAESLMNEAVDRSQRNSTRTRSVRTSSVISDVHPQYIARLGTSRRSSSPVSVLSTES